MAGATLSDDIAVLSACMFQLFRAGARGRHVSQLGLAAKAAGISIGQAQQAMDGLITLPPHQAIVFAGAVLEQQRAQAASYAMQLRQGHAGSNLMSDGQPLTREAVAASKARLEKDFPAWTVKVDGLKTLGEAPKLVWKAERDDWAASGIDAGELREKIGLVEAQLAADADQQARYHDGRGVTRRMGRTA